MPEPARISLAALFLALCGACASPAALVAPASTAPGLGPGPDRKVAVAHETEVRAAVEEARAAFRRNDSAGVDQALARARTLAGTSVSLGNRVTEADAGLRVERGDLQGAAAAILARIALAQRAGDPSELDLHDRMLFLCEARGDRIGALLEALEMRSAVERMPPPWSPALRQGYYWQRAHTLRVLAETLTGDDRTAAILYARKARDEFAELARQSGHSLQSIQVLDEEIARLDGDCAAALAAARSLPVDELDPQDLYTTSTVYEACGERATGAALRARITAEPDLDLFHAVYRHMAREAEAASHPAQ